MKQRFFQLALLCILVLSCKEEAFDPKTSFTRIYDSFHSDQQFHPIDIAATESGFLVLAGQSFDASDFMGVQLIRLDETGSYVETRDLSSDYVIPVGDLIAIDSGYYFFAMRPVSLGVSLIKTTTNLTTVEEIPLNLYYPLAAAKTADDNLLLLSYDPDAQLSVISRMDTDGNLLNSTGYTIGPGSDVEANILNHYIDPERSALPFFCGESPGGQVYFNGIFNYSLSLVFTDFNDTPTGVVQGQNFNGGVSAALPVSASNFAVFGFQFNDNFIRPTIPLNTAGISSSIDLFASTVSEFKSRTPARIRLYTLNETDYVIFAAETENRQVALYFYEAATGELKGIHKIGYLNPYTLSSIAVDDENNLLVLGTTYVSGRFERIYVSKIPEKDVKGFMK